MGTERKKWRKILPEMTIGKRKPFLHSVKSTIIPIQSTVGSSLFEVTNRNFKVQQVLTANLLNVMCLNGNQHSFKKTKKLIK